MLKFRILGTVESAPNSSDRRSVYSLCGLVEVGTPYRCLYCGTEYTTQTTQHFFCDGACQSGYEHTKKLKIDMYHGGIKHESNTTP